ncbi:hypothetical protein [Streptomyces cinerochromogenes]|uniref:hypothetical protein n=1 Tax=Streptomyces cinerochromogenes TaxID=66422 RepID=UPI0033B7DF87
MNGRVLGRVADYERAEQSAADLVSEEPEQGLAFLARAGTRATLHRFAPALTDLTTAERLGADPTDVDAERAAVHQARDHAQKLLHEVARRRSDFRTLGALAGLYAQRTDITCAERLFAGRGS